MKLSGSPSSVMEFSTDRVGSGSSSLMVPVATASDSRAIAPTGSAKRMVTISSNSSRRSSLMGTVRVWVVTPASKVSVPEIGV